jgi:hypothetical protein
MRTISILLMLLCGAAAALGKDKPPVVHRIPLPTRPNFSELDWLTGEWAGKTSEKSPPGEISLSVSFDLDKRYLIFRGVDELAATPSLPEYKESWLGVLTQDLTGGGFILRVFSDTGFMTRYRATVVAGTVTLNQEGGEQPPPGWLFRRILQRTDVGELLVTLQAAPPQKSFFEYYTAKLTHAAPSAAPPTPAVAKPATE